MKHKKFNETYPYTYYIKNKHTQKKYYGVRYGNIRLNITPEEDFAKEYFTSSDYVNLNEQNKSDWIIKLHYTFDSIEEAQEYEHKLLTKVYKRSDWLNKTNNKAIFNDNESTQKQIESLKKTRKKKYWNNSLKKHTEKSKLKMSESSKGKTSHRKNKSLKEEYGFKKADEISKKLSKALAGKEPWNKGKLQTKEQRENNPFLQNNPSKNKELMGPVWDRNTNRYMIEFEGNLYLGKGNKSVKEIFQKFIKPSLNIGINKWKNNLEIYNSKITKLKLINLGG